MVQKWRKLFKTKIGDQISDGDTSTQNQVPLFGLSNFKSLVFPIGLLSILFSFWGVSGFADLASFLGTILPFMAFSLNIVIPLLLLFLTLFRKIKINNT